MTVPYVRLIHSVDTPKLFFEIERWCRQNGFSIDVLLEMHIASEESKQGFSDEEVMDFLAGIEKARPWPPSRRTRRSSAGSSLI